MSRSIIITSAQDGIPIKPRRVEISPSFISPLIDVVEAWFIPDKS